MCSSWYGYDGNGRWMVTRFKSYWFPKVAGWLRNWADWLDPVIPPLPVPLMLAALQIVDEMDRVTRVTLSNEQAIKKYRQIKAQNALRMEFPDASENEINLYIELAVRELHHAAVVL